jgi:AraC family transcriptional regulator of adaptative response/methylated-DNA-[protein]-cysteine methyltransferase
MIAPAPHASDSPARELRLAAVERACRLIESADEAPSLAALAAAAGLSVWHFHRVFKGATGVTPKEYADAHRARRARAALEGGRSVTDAIYEAGFASSGRFYEASDRMLGMTPTQYRAGGATTEIRFAVGSCSLGFALVAQTARGVCAILLGASPAALRAELGRRFPRARLVAGDREFEAVVARVVACVETPRLGLDLPLDVRGTAFQQRVWRALREIPAGTTATYGEIARRIGAPRAVRAVAGACGANPVAVAIPCHRVVREDGGLGGYRWGLPRKRALLSRESSK